MECPFSLIKTLAICKARSFEALALEFEYCAKEIRGHSDNFAASPLEYKDNIQAGILTTLGDKKPIDYYTSGC